MIRQEKGTDPDGGGNRWGEQGCQTAKKRVRKWVEDHREGIPVRIKRGACKLFHGGRNF